MGLARALTMALSIGDEVFALAMALSIGDEMFSFVVSLILLAGVGVYLEQFFPGTCRLPSGQSSIVV